MKLTTDLKLHKRTYDARTYKVSHDRTEGFLDGAEALKQAIHKQLSTEKYEYLIYSFSYGIAWKELIGKDRPYVRAEMKRKIQEALLRDDRIREVDGFEFSFQGDMCQCSFNVSSIYGDIKIETEVTV